MLDLKHSGEHNRRNKVGLANKNDFAEIYTEVTRTVGHKKHAHVVWKLKNRSSRFKWAPGM